MKLRKVTLDDCRLVFEWANESVARKMSFTEKTIAWEEHCKWYKNRLKSEFFTMYIASDDQDKIIGQVRFDENTNQEAEIAINIDKNQRSKGYGPLLLQAGTQKIFCETHIKKIHAFIREENKPSIKAFEKAGFSFYKTGERNSHPFLHYILEKK